MILPSGGTHVLTAVKNAQIFGSEQFLHESLNLFSLTEYWNTTAAEVKPRCVYSILKPHGQSSRYQVRILLPRQKQSTCSEFHHLPSWSKAVVCVSTPRMYLRCGNFLVQDKNQYFLSLVMVLIYFHFSGSTFSWFKRFQNESEISKLRSI